MSAQAKVGLLVVTLALIMLYTAPGQHRRAPVLGHSLKLLFTQVHGLREGDPVKLAGVPSGVITHIDFASDELRKQFSLVTGGLPLVEVSVSLNATAKVPSNSYYQAVGNLNGTRWIDITPAGGDSFIGANEPFFAERTSIQDDQLTRTLRTLRTLSDQTVELRDAIADAEFRRQVKDTVSNLRFYSRELAEASRTAPEQLAAVERQMDEQEARLHSQIDSMDAKVAEVRNRLQTMTPQVKENLAAWRERIDKSSGEIEQMLAQAVDLTERYNQAVNDAVESYTDPAKIEKFVITARKWSRQIDAIMAIATDLHSLSSDPKVQEDLKGMITKLKGRSEDLNSKVDQLERKLDKLPF
ncbi:MAG: MCE family protein [Candidatus Eremiobacteraeota bacterium]|nr:MCE family protein [Candidatus Eremiobacteraeota bacterium]